MSRVAAGAIERLGGHALLGVVATIILGLATAGCTSSHSASSVSNPNTQSVSSTIESSQTSVTSARTATETDLGLSMSRLTTFFKVYGVDCTYGQDTQSTSPSTAWVADCTGQDAASGAAYQAEAFGYSGTSVQCIDVNIVSSPNLATTTKFFDYVARLPLRHVNSASLQKLLYDYIHTPQLAIMREAVSGHLPSVAPIQVNNIALPGDSIDGAPPSEFDAEFSIEPVGTPGCGGAIGQGS